MTQREFVKASGWGYGICVSGEVQRVAFESEDEAIEHARLIWKPGLEIEIVEVEISKRALPARAGEAP